MNEILIYSDIGDSAWFDSVSAKDVKSQLDGMQGDVTVRINSPGGSVFDGFSIYNLLNQHDGKVTVLVDGMAASAASVVAMAGDEILMAENALMMIHDPWTLMAGSADDMRETANLLDKIKGSIVKTYQSTTDLTEAEISDMMAAETWFTADEAIAHGFATGTVEGMAVAASTDKPWINKAPEIPVSEELPDCVAAKISQMREAANKLAIDNKRKLLKV